MTLADTAVSIRGLRKRYGAVQAVDGVDLDIERGEIFSLLGPNGAGKTTLVEILEGYRPRDAGEVAVLGSDPQRGGREWRARIGIVPQTTAIFEELTVREVVSHFASLYPRPMPPARAIELVGLTAETDRRCSTLSGGRKRRVELALGIIGQPEILFLDEPTTGFDPEARRQTWQIIDGLAELGTTILLTTHYLDEAEALAGRVAVIAGGRVLDLAPPSEIGGRQRALTRVSFQLGGALAAAGLPEGIADPGHITIEGDTVHMQTGTPTAAVAQLAAWANAQGISELPGLTVAHPSLEEIYLTMIGQSAHEESGAPA